MIELRPVRLLAAAAAVGVALIAAPASAQQSSEQQPSEQATAEQPTAQQASAGPAEDSPEEPARFPPSSVRWKLVAGGVGLTAGAYGLGAACAAAWPDVPGAEGLYVPVAGPWIMLAQSGCSPDDPGCGAILAMRGVLLVLDGLIQAGGLAVAGEGLFMTTESEVAAPPARRATASVTVTPVPLVTERQTGLGLVGSF